MPQVELLLAIGLYAQSWHLKDMRCGNLTQTVKNWQEIVNQTNRPCIIPLPHPSWRNSGWIKRNPWFENELLPIVKVRIRQLI
jgi:uracil-DNA glycosylase